MLVPGYLTIPMSGIKQMKTTKAAKASRMSLSLSQTDAIERQVIEWRPGHQPVTRIVRDMVIWTDGRFQEPTITRTRN